MPKEQPYTADMMKKIADFDPKIIELNNQVLFGDIWERPSFQARPELDYGCSPRRAVSDQRTPLSPSARQRERGKPRPTCRGIHPSGFLRGMAECVDGNQDG